MGRLRSPESAHTLRELMLLLKQNQFHYILEKETASLFSQVDCPIYSRNTFADHCDIVIVVGGDGSLLQAAHAVVNKGIPVVGINRGRLGFLTDISPDELNSRILKLLSGEYQVEKRFLLQLTIYNAHGANEAAITEFALNDIVLFPGEHAQMIEFEIHIDGHLMCYQRADGQIITTPTGSTAYSLSAGGPILHPSLDAIALVPMFSHTLTARPVVIDSHSKIEIFISKKNTFSPFVSCDGFERIRLQPGACLLVERKQEMLTLLHPHDYDYFEILRSKLLWQTPL